MALRRVEILDRQGELFEVVDALGSAGRLTHLLHGRQEQADEDGNDGDHDEQFDEREGTAARPPRRALGGMAEKRIMRTSVD